MCPGDKDYMLQEYILHTVYVLISSKSVLSLELVGNIFLYIISKVINTNQMVALFALITNAK